MAIYVDFDSTLAHYDKWRGPTHTGKPIWSMLKRVRGWIKGGETVVIFTARASNKTAIKAIEKWCCQWLGKKLRVTNVKGKDAELFYDDRAVKVTPNKGLIEGMMESKLAWLKTWNGVIYRLSGIDSLNQVVCVQRDGNYVQDRFWWAVSGDYTNILNDEDIHGVGHYFNNKEEAIKDFEFVYPRWETLSRKVTRPQVKFYWRKFDKETKRAASVPAAECILDETMSAKEYKMAMFGGKINSLAACRGKFWINKSGTLYSCGASEHEQFAANVFGVKVLRYDDDDYGDYSPQLYARGWRRGTVVAGDIQVNGSPLSSLSPSQKRVLEGEALESGRSLIDCTDWENIKVLVRGTRPSSFDLGESKKYKYHLPRSGFVNHSTVESFVQMLEGRTPSKICCMVVIPEEFHEKLKALGDKIDKEDIYTEDGKDSYGLEKDFHVTALYGLLPGRIDLEDIKDAIPNKSQVSMTLGKVSMFENDSYDVMKVEVDSPDLHAMNARLRELPYENDYDQYIPHLTIGYVKKGTGKKYVDDDSVDGLEVVSKEIDVSFGNGKHEFLELGGALSESDFDPASIDFDAATEAERCMVDMRKRIKWSAQDVQKRKWHVLIGLPLGGRVYRYTMAIGPKEALRNVIAKKKKSLSKLGSNVGAIYNAVVKGGTAISTDLRYHAARKVVK